MKWKLTMIQAMSTIAFAVGRVASVKNLTSLSLVVTICLTIGCATQKELVVMCPQPVTVPTVTYLTSSLSKETQAPDIIKAMAFDLMAYQDVEDQLRVALKAYQDLGGTGGFSEVAK